MRFGVYGFGMVELAIGLCSFYGGGGWMFLWVCLVYGFQAFGFVYIVDQVEYVISFRHDVSQIQVLWTDLCYQVVSGYIVGWAVEKEVHYCLGGGWGIMGYVAGWAVTGLGFFDFVQVVVEWQVSATYL